MTGNGKLSPTLLALYFPWTNVGSRNQKALCKTIVTTLFYITNYNSFAPGLPQCVLCEAATVSYYPACLCFFLLIISTFILVATTCYITLLYPMFFNTWKTTKCFPESFGLKGTHLLVVWTCDTQKKKKRKKPIFSCYQCFWNIVHVLWHLYMYIIDLAICLR